jgi:TonB family protein
MASSSQKVSVVTGGAGFLGSHLTDRLLKPFFCLSVFARVSLAAAAVALLLWPRQLSAAPPSSARGIHGQALTQDQMKGVVLSMTHPHYPIEARQARITGSGMFEMRINPKTGRVKGVLVVQSTGSQILDSAVVRAFSQWRFKPGIVTAVRSPVIFIRTGERWVF